MGVCREGGVVRETIKESERESRSPIKREMGTERSDWVGKR